MTQRLSEVKKEQLVNVFSRKFQYADVDNIKEITNVTGIKSLSLTCDEQKDSISSRKRDYHIISSVLFEYTHYGAYIQNILLPTK